MSETANQKRIDIGLYNSKFYPDSQKKSNSRVNRLVSDNREFSPGPYGIAAPLRLKKN